MFWSIYAVENIESIYVLPPICSTHSPVGVDPVQNFQSNLIQNIKN